MKARDGFVSNSSTSSFIVRKDGLTKVQLNIVTDFTNIICRISEILVWRREDIYYDDLKDLRLDLNTYKISDRINFFYFEGRDDVLLEDIFNELGIDTEEWHERNIYED